MDHPSLTRRRFLAQSTALTASGFALANLAAEEPTPAQPFQSQWANDLNRVWTGPEFWANPLQDWRLKDGRVECIRAAQDRNLHVLTRELMDRRGDLQMSVTIGRIGSDSFASDGKGNAGFKVGVLGTMRDEPERRDYRNNLAFSRGIDCGVTAAGALFWGDPAEAEAPAFNPLSVASIRLNLVIRPDGETYAAVLTASDSSNGQELATIEKREIAPARLVGNLAIGCNFGRPANPDGKAKQSGPPVTGSGRFWFNDWSIAGSKVAGDDGRAFGPIYFNQYTLSGNKLKMTAQMPPLGESDEPTVRLEVQRNGEWIELASSPIHPLARIARFEISNWNGNVDTPYRIRYQLNNRTGSTSHEYQGMVRRDPTDQDELCVADVSCNYHTAFPNAAYVASVARLNPDLLAFTGDQFYENTAGYGIETRPLENAALDYLRKWCYHGWTWRDLTKDRPSISIPDDHDVYQGNLWGEGGAPSKTTQEAGGYDHLPEWVNIVHLTQTSHHPAPHDPTPGKQRISHYYGSLTYGGISFAILADRQYKSGPEGKVPPTGTRGDHVIDMEFDPKMADLDGLQLLGDKQLQFIREWVRDWKGAEMKAVISQTIFAGMATTHGSQRELLRIDYDQNGWPQSARNAALREIRKAFAFHLAGDQHLPAVIHYGIDTHRDAGVAFAGPAVNVGYPRWWEPTAEVHQRQPGQGLTGDFLDHFGHPMTVLAFANGPEQPPKGVVEQIIAKTSGYGQVIFNKRKRTIRVECWSWGTDFGQLDAPQFETWPVETSQRAQYGREAVAYLPKLQIQGNTRALVEVFDSTDELVYALRLAGDSFQPHVFAATPHHVRVSDPETGREVWLKNLTASVAASEAGETEVVLPD